MIVIGSETAVRTPLFARSGGSACRPARIRSARSEDAPAIAAMHQRLSNESVYLRYLRPYRPSQAELERILDDQDPLFGSGSRALVAVAAGNPHKVIGLAYYVRDAHDPQAGELAVVVEDAWQNCGVGKMLLSGLEARAAADGLSVFRAMVLPANQRILSMARKHPQLKSIRYQDGLMVIETSLTSRAGAR